MAEFCTKCATKLFGEEAKPEIDVMEIFNNLQPGFSSSGWICEGCGLVTIGKTEDGELQVIRLKPEDEEDQTCSWEKY